MEVGSDGWLKEVGDRLRYVRTSSGYKQPDMAAAANVDLRTYGNYERGVRAPNAEVLLGLAGAGWNVNWILTGEGPERVGRVSEDGLTYESQELSGQHLMVATELADEALRGLWLPRNQYFDLVALIYDALVKGLPYAEIIAFARPAAVELAGGGSDDGGAEVGGEGAADPGRGAASGG